MESSFYCMILSKIVINVLYIVLSIVGFKFLLVHMVFILLMNCTVVK